MTERKIAKLEGVFYSNVHKQHSFFVRNNTTNHTVYTSPKWYKTENDAKVAFEALVSKLICDACCAGGKLIRRTEYVVELEMLKDPTPPPQHTKHVVTAFVKEGNSSMYGVAVYIDGEMAIEPLALFDTEMRAYKDYMGGRRKQLEEILHHMGYIGISLEVPKSTADDFVKKIEDTSTLTNSAVIPAIPRDFDVLSN